MLLSQLLCLLNDFLDGADHVEGLLRQSIVLTCSETGTNINISKVEVEDTAYFRNLNHNGEYTYHQGCS